MTKLRDTRNKTFQNEKFNTNNKTIVYNVFTNLISTPKIVWVY